MRINVDQRLAVEVLDRKTFEVSTARVLGDATEETPARFIALHRHADMADELPVNAARQEVENSADELVKLLATLDANTIMDLVSFVEKAHGIVQRSGTYYSFLVAIVSTARVLAAGIGNVNVQLWTSDGSRPVLRPTVQAVGDTRVLTSALGLGFDPRQIQAADLSLGDGDRIIVGIDADVGSLQPVRTMPPGEVLQHIVESVSTERSAIVGVIASQS